MPRWRCTQGCQCSTLQSDKFPWCQVGQGEQRAAAQAARHWELPLHLGGTAFDPGAGTWPCSSLLSCHYQTKHAGVDGSGPVLSFLFNMKLRM